MAPISLHALLPRDDPSLGELFHHFPAKVWMLFKFILFGICLMLALYAIVVGIFFSFASLVIYVPETIRVLRSGKWRHIVEGWREKAGHVRRMLKRRNAGGDAEAVDAEELERLGSHDAEGREGSVGGETLFESEEDEEEDGQARKKEMDLDSEDFMEGKP